MTIKGEDQRKRCIRINPRSEREFQYTSYEHKAIWESIEIQISVSINKWFSYRKLELYF